MHVCVCGLLLIYLKFTYQSLKKNWNITDYNDHYFLISLYNKGDLGSIPGLGRFPGEGNGNPYQHSCLENPHGQRSLEGYSSWGYKESDMTEWLSTAHYLRYEGPEETKQGERKRRDCCWVLSSFPKRFNSWGTRFPVRLYGKGVVAQGSHSFFLNH